MRACEAGLRALRRGSLVALAILCFARAASPAHAEELRVGTPAERVFAFLPLRIGMQKGFFSKYGLDIQATDFSGGAKLQQGMVAGVVDMALSSATDLAFVVKGAPELAVAALGYGATMGVIVPYDSPAKGIDDIKHKKIGVTTVGSFTEWLLHRLMQKKGWGLDDVTVVPIGAEVQNEVALLTTHQIDGSVAPVGLGFQLESAQRARLLITSFDVGGELLGVGVFASDTMMQNRPDTVRRFLKALFEVIAWMRTNKAEAVEIARTFTKFDLDVENKEYDAMMPSFSSDGKFLPDGLKTLQKSFVEMKVLDHAPDMSKLYTEEFLPER